MKCPQWDANGPWEASPKQCCPCLGDAPGQELQWGGPGGTWAGTDVGGYYFLFV